MPQKLNISPEQAQSAKAGLKDEMIPTLEGAKHYFSYVIHQGAPILCIYDNGQWRPTTQNELMQLIR